MSWTLSRLLLPLLLLAAALSMPRMAQAQVIVVVNGAPITALDVEQRAKILSAGNPKLDRDRALKDLIDDQLKISKAKTYGLEVSEAEINNGFETMARRQRMSPEQFSEFLQRSGIAPSALKARIKAELTWGQLVRGKFSSTLQIGESDINQALQARSPDEQSKVSHIYTLFPITVIVPRGSNDAVVAQKSREAENLRTRFQNCKDGLALARGLRDVAVRDAINRSSADLTPQLRELLGNMQVGQLTIPELTAQGLQMYALCDRKESAGGDTPAKRQVRDELFAKRFEGEARKYLEEIRRGAMIEYKK